MIERKYKYFTFVLMLTLVLGFTFEARGAYMGVILFLLVYCCNRLVKIPPFIMMCGITFILLNQILLLLNPSIIADEILSYRPTIWNYYIYEGLENFLFGGGPILTYVSEGAAAYYQSMIGRGVGTAYGTQSMYVLYFYESGIIGLFLLMFIMFIVFCSKSKYVIPFFSISVLAFMETIKIGAVSIYGLPFTYFLVLSLVTKSKQ
ncbi:O-antigen ligase family protein [Shewanella metallivivens]|uniref:O-antigen ligase family protein n=1 Tax=Shewanella metallivivens TaxID=2872342 RepID=A0ABT5TIS8_9GAMM|nr:O-antigen ligase family protein [Shewanella metallivivens]MDD8057630.1 O-antigen ligase family protein [Shewanella metallivivens]